MKNLIILLCYVILTSCSGFSAGKTDLSTKGFHLGPTGPQDPTGCRVEVSSWIGAYYRKIRSTSSYSGLYGTIKVPEFIEDPARYLKVSNTNLKNRPDWDGSLDRASLYVGGQSDGYHIDLGLGWGQIFSTERSRVLVDESATSWEQKLDSKNWYKLFEKISPVNNPNQPWKEDFEPYLKDPSDQIVAQGRHNIRVFITEKKLKYLFAFKPFVRTLNYTVRGTLDKIYKQNVTDDFSGSSREATIYDLGDSEIVNGKIQQRFHQWFDKTPYVFIPGDEVKISLTHDGPRFTLKVFSARTQELVWFKFYQEGFDTNGNSYSFKRVTSIDQYRLSREGTRSANEGPDARALLTKAKLQQGGWFDFYALIKTPDGFLKVPIGGNNCWNTRPADLVDLYDQIFISRVADQSMGREILDIEP